MRAHEFINEARKKSPVKNGMKPSKEAEAAMTGAHRAGGSQDRGYDLGRVMQHVAATDGKTMPKIDKESWVGKTNTAHPYTKEESDMLKLAYKTYGLDWDDILKPNSKNKSEEMSDTNSKSPINSFKGY